MRRLQCSVGLVLLSLAPQASSFTLPTTTSLSSPPRQHDDLVISTTKHPSRHHHHRRSTSISSTSLNALSIRVPTSVQDRLVHFLSGNRQKHKRPDWARDWMPTWLMNLRPPIQLATVLVFYIFHLTVLAQRSVPFPVQLIPNERGHFQSIGLDSLAGMATLGAYQYFRRQPKSKSNTTVDEEAAQEAPTTTELASSNSTTTATATASLLNATVPSLLSTPLLRNSPWKSIYESKYSRFTSFLSLCALFQAYFWTGRLSLWWEDTFYLLANSFPITVAMHRSLCVLFGHLSWIVLGGSILRVIPRPQNFFQQKWYTQKFRDTQWVWWTIGGYFVSSWFFNVADFVNQLILPVSILEQAQESVVGQLINPENNDWAASFVGYIAPCITAPWWEEVLYRGFLFPALILQMKYKWAVLWSGVLFSIHHLSPTACIPLAVLGWTWSILYAKSGNLLTTILVHAMWNSRIFLGSWLGL